VHHLAGRLGPIRDDLEPARRRFAAELRGLFGELGISVRGYARQQDIHATLVTRYLNGDVMPSEEFVLDLAAAVEHRASGSRHVDTAKLLSARRAAEDARPRGWGNATRLRKEITEARNTARVARADLQELMENYAVAQNRIAELERLLAALRGNAIPERAITAGPHWNFNRDTLLTRGATEPYVEAVDLATDQILGGLADPASMIPSPTEARVFVPALSGKTAYISALTAKAVDAGYRLILVISPPLKVLRSQLQARLQESLAPLPDGGVPLLWVTSEEVDLRPSLLLAQAMRFEKTEPNLPLYDPANLGKTMARLLVVKKNVTVIRKTIALFEALQPSVSDVPALVIDADGRPMLPGSAMERTMARLKSALPRAQHVTFAALEPTEADSPNAFMMWLPRPPDLTSSADRVGDLP
jgi:hypothetical protein